MRSSESCTELTSVATASNLESSSSEGLLTIGSLAKQADVTVRTLRYYEEMDLIGPVKRSSGKYRLYNQRALERVRAILALQELNFSLEEILAVLGPYSSSQSYTREEQVAHTRESLSRRQQLIREKIDRMNELCADIEKRLQRLDSSCVPCISKHSSHLEGTHCQDSCSELAIHD